MITFRKILTVTAAVAAMISPLSAEKSEKSEDGFISLFDGKSFDGWKIAEKPDSFIIEDGAIVAKGSRAHAFYTGKVKDGKFRTFELRLDVMTKANSNGGVFIHSEYQETGWPKGYEIQVNNTHKDPKKSGGLYSIVDNMEPFEDDKWMAYVITVANGNITVSVNGKELVSHTPKEGESRLLKDGGLIALQAHDPDSTVYYKNIRIKPLD